jgi:hypothetical protein
MRRFIYSRIHLVRNPVPRAAFLILCACATAGLAATDPPPLPPRSLPEGAGIPAFTETRTPLRVGAHRLSVELRPPVVISIADKPYGWGFHQFPRLARFGDGRLAVKWSMHLDSIVSYGKATYGAAESKDGRHWRTIDELPEEFDVVPVRDGSRLRVHTPEAVSIEKLQMPAPVGEKFDTVREVQRLYFRHSELPERFQGVFLKRQLPGSPEWIEERAKLLDPAAVRHSRGGLMPVLWWGDIQHEPEGTLIAGIYPGYCINDAEEVEKESGVFFYRSYDGGRSWSIVSRILYRPDTDNDPIALDRLGFTEPTFHILSDATYVCVLRTSDVVGIGPMYQSISRDRGATWSKPRVITRAGVLPKLLQLENGVVVLSAGRPGVQLRFALPNDVGNWSEALEMLPYSSDRDSVSCGYTDLLATGPDRFLLVYSDFRFPVEGGANRKAIKVREIIVRRD